MRENTEGAARSRTAGNRPLTPQLVEGRQLESDGGASFGMLATKTGEQVKGACRAVDPAGGSKREDPQVVVRLVAGL
jgi:hypothetical protein